MKKLFAILVLGLFGQTSVPAIDVGTIIGYAKTFRNTIIGATTVTPACALGYWRLNSTGTYSTTQFYHNWTINRSVTTGAYSYVHTYTSTPGSSGSSSEPFNVASLPSIRNYHCDLSSTDPVTGKVTPYIYDILEAFYVHVWPAAVTHTGYFSPQAPYSAWCKAYCTTLPSSCAAITPSTREIRNGVQLWESGTVNLIFALVNYEYSWPPLCWAGDIYDN